MLVHRCARWARDKLLSLCHVAAPDAVVKAVHSRHQGSNALQVGVVLALQDLVSALRLLEIALVLEMALFLLS